MSITIRTSDRLSDTRTYFDYASIVKKITELLESKYGCAFRLYFQEDSSEVWDALDEDIRSGFPELEHAASVYDLVETRMFSYECDPEPEKTGYDIRHSVSNNVFVYSKHKVAFVRVPREVQYGLNFENLIFAAGDECMGAFLADMQARQLQNRKILVFTDTRDGLDRSRETTVQPVTRDDVIMDETLKTQLYRSVDEFFSKDRSFFQTYGVPYKRGILLYGKPGNGKTTLVKSISATVGAPVAYWQITEFTNSESIQQVFAAALKLAPMVLVIEDIDSMPASCRSFFLNTLDGATSKEGLFLIGTTNYPDKIDPALMNRAGRFDRAYEVKLPDEALRLAYLTRKGMNRLVETDAVAVAARRTEGFTFAQLSELYVSAALQFHYESALNLEELISGMKADFSKGRSREWMTEGRSRSLGFVPAD
ncbi:AAA family ATPase [Cohnella faecalis]|uniref:ATP-binding protein n=1 Tax=Cohnella faecalis TaxID=2315694 RepID=A0A398CID5_9BACL|nr:ATP-binding protein [Cohnella faecalis]RIE02503.1 ATP-binding protein [Cohnella faecalis]